MNTLPRTITAQVLANPNKYHDLRRHWSSLIRSAHRHDLTAAHHLLYLILLGKDWRKGFTCAINRRKLENGAFYGWVLFRALTALHLPSCEAELLAPFDGLITPDMLRQVRRMVPAQNIYAYRPEQFADRCFPFEAYAPIEAETAENRSQNIDA